MTKEIVLADCVKPHGKERVGWFHISPKRDIASLRGIQLPFSEEILASVAGCLVRNGEELSEQFFGPSYIKEAKSAAWAVSLFVYRNKLDMDDSRVVYLSGYVLYNILDKREKEALEEDRTQLKIMHQKMGNALGSYALHVLSSEGFSSFDIIKDFMEIQGVQSQMYLTQREKEILLLISKGFSNNDLSSAFGLGESTVKNGITKIFKKLGVSTRTLAAVKATRPF